MNEPDPSLYPIVVVPLSDEDGGGYLAYAPDLRGCMSDGETREEAVANAEDALAGYVEVMLRDGVTLPRPGAIADALAEQRTAVERLRRAAAHLDRYDGGDWTASSRAGA